MTNHRHTIWWCLIVSVTLRVSFIFINLTQYNFNVNEILNIFYLCSQRQYISAINYRGYSQEYYLLVMMLLPNPDTQYTIDYKEDNMD